jgi:hypothetical protein
MAPILTANALTVVLVYFFAKVKGRRRDALPTFG